MLPFQFFIFLIHLAYTQIYKDEKREKSWPSPEFEAAPAVFAGVFIALSDALFQLSRKFDQLIFHWLIDFLNKSITLSTKL